MGLRLLLSSLRSNPSRHQSKVLYRSDVRRRRKTGKYRIVRVKETGMQSPRMETWNQGDRPPDAEENPGTRYLQRLEGIARPRVHSRYIHGKQDNTSAGPLTPPKKTEPRLPPPRVKIIKLSVGRTFNGKHFISSTRVLRP